MDGQENNRTLYLYPCSRILRWNVYPVSIQGWIDEASGCLLGMRWTSPSWPTAKHVTYLRLQAAVTRCSPGIHGPSLSALESLVFAGITISLSLTKCVLSAAYCCTYLWHHYIRRCSSGLQYFSMLFWVSMTYCISSTIFLNLQGPL